MKLSLIILITLISTGELFSCSCINRENVRYTSGNAKVAFQGKVVNVEYINKSDTTFISVNGQQEYKISLVNAHHLITLEVLNTYKGRIKKDTIQITSVAHGSCAELLEVGKTYFVFANKGPYKNLHIDYCSGCKEFNQKDEDILISLAE